MNIGIIGCGAVGRKRAQHLAGARLIHCADTDLARASQVASLGDGCIAGTDWRALLDRADINAVVIATPQDSQVEIARAAINAGIHVLVEKPAARHVEKSIHMCAAATRFISLPTVPSMMTRLSAAQISTSFVSSSPSASVRVHFS